MTLGARVKKVLDKVANGNKMMFASLIDANPNTIQKHITNGTANLEIVEKILATYPDISAEWLMRGVGDMYEKQSQAIISKHIEGDNSSVDYNNTDVVMQLVSTLSQQLKEKDAQIASLISKI